MAKNRSKLPEELNKNSADKYAKYPRDKICRKVKFERVSILDRMFWLNIKRIWMSDNAEETSQMWILIVYL